MILCCGEALIDMIPETTVSGRFGYVPHCGGAALNTARALGRLGVSVGLLSGLSTDRFGQFLVQSLRDSHVDLSCLRTSPRSSPMSFVHLSDGDAVYSFHDEASAGRMLHTEELPDLPDHVSTLVFGGISLAADPCGVSFEDLARYQGHERVMWIDPNIRPSYIRNEGTYRGRLDRMIALADIVKVSEDDLDWMYPGPTSRQRRIAPLWEGGTAMVIVTEGNRGASVYLRGQDVVRAPSHAVKTVDTVGAGDTFNAGFLAALADQDALERNKVHTLDRPAVEAALDMAMRAAAVSVSRAGATPPWRSEL